MNWVQNKRLDLTKSALAEGTAAFAGQPQRWADNQAKRAE